VEGEIQPTTPALIIKRSVFCVPEAHFARFGNANEHGDWEIAHHVLTYANALDQMLLRIGENGGAWREAGRGILHGAMVLCLTRYLNVPPARIPGDGPDPLDNLPAEAETIRAALLDAFDRPRQVDLAARLVIRHLTLGYSPQLLIVTLARAVLRGDSGFHAYEVWRPGSGSSRLGATATRAGASVLRSPGISRLVHQPCAQRCRLQTPPGA
jgi:hypothetical protein